MWLLNGKKNILILVFFTTTIGKLVSSPVDVRVFSRNIITSVIFSPIEGDYEVYGDNRLILNCDASCIFQMNIKNDSIHIITFEEDLGYFSTIQIKSKVNPSAFRIKCVTPLSIVRTYDDDLTVKITEDKTQLILVNKINVESYIAGVMQSESGKANNMEYNKMQAILCRTYLLAHLHRHAEEGFNVCDDVHCQAYLSRASESNIKEAVIATKGLVIVDNNLNLISAAFHSNCGGETCNSEDVWTISTPYLKSIKDTFCLRKTNAKWEQTISKEKWNDYLTTKGQHIDSLVNPDVSAKSFYQTNGRGVFYMNGDIKIPLKTIRNDFNLKSTFFSIEVKDDAIIFKGKGYGHGVGLCQEGAMEMSKKHYNYSQILHYYFKDVHIVDQTSLSYFKQE